MNEKASGDGKHTRQKKLRARGNIKTFKNFGKSLRPTRDKNKNKNTPEVRSATIYVLL